MIFLFQRRQTRLCGLCGGGPAGQWFHHTLRRLPAGTPSPDPPPDPPIEICTSSDAGRWCLGFVDIITLNEVEVCAGKPQKQSLTVYPVVVLTKSVANFSDWPGIIR